MSTELECQKLFGEITQIKAEIKELWEKYEQQVQVLTGGSNFKEGIIWMLSQLVEQQATLLKKQEEMAQKTNKKEFWFMSLIISQVVVTIGAVITYLITKGLT